MRVSSRTSPSAVPCVIPAVVLEGVDYYTMELGPLSNVNNVIRPRGRVLGTVLADVPGSLVQSTVV